MIQRKLVWIPRIIKKKTHFISMFENVLIVFLKNVFYFKIFFIFKNYF